jgi:SAM-dependent methyltransferase
MITLTQGPSTSLPGATACDNPFVHRRVRKIFTDAPRSGSSPDYWDDEWVDFDLTARVERAMERPGDFEALVSRALGADPVLEAGCGSGWLVAWLQQLGHAVIGLDFAVAPLHRANSQGWALPLVGGDLQRLPFPDATFATVLSLGALEHIETGPERALAEHRRALRDGGRLVITLPRLSWAKRLNDLRLVGRPGATYHSPRDRWVERCAQMCAERPRSRRFVQYELSTRAWVGIIEAAGFRVRSHRPIGVGAGLGESRWVRRYSAHRADLLTSSSSAAHGRRSPLRRYWSAGVHQNPATPGESAAAYVMARAFGHMVFIVADAVPQRKTTAARAPTHPTTAGAPVPY